MTWWTVFKLEGEILRRDRSVYVVIGLFALFSLFAAASGGRLAAQLSDGLERSATEVQSRYADNEAALKQLESSSKPVMSKDPRNTVWMGQEGAASIAILPPAPLAPIAAGQRDIRPQAVRVTSEVNLIHERETETAMVGPTRMATGAFDPAFFFVVLFPLVVIGLSYELLSGERERGTLAMLLSQPVSQLGLIVGKAASRFALLCVVTFVCAILGLIISGASLGSGTALLHSILYLMVLFAWGAFWFALAIWVNSRGGASAKNALTLVGFWLVFVVVLPGVSEVVVDTVYPPPSQVELLHEAREAAQAVEEKLNALEGRHDVDPKQGATAQAIVEVQEALLERSEPVLAEVREQTLLRNAFLNRLRFISPAILAQASLEDIAGASALRHDHFDQEADRYHRAFRAFFAERIKAGTPFSTEDFKSIPAFGYQELETSRLLTRIGMNIGVLLALAAILVAAARSGLSRIGRLTR